MGFIRSLKYNVRQRLFTLIIFLSLEVLLCDWSRLRLEPQRSHRVSHLKLFILVGVENKTSQRINRTLCLNIRL